MAQKNALEIPANLLLAPHFWALLEPSKKGLADSRFALKSGHRGPRHLLPEDYHRPPRNASWFLDRPRQGDGARRPLSAAMDVPRFPSRLPLHRPLPDSLRPRLQRSMCWCSEPAVVCWSVRGPSEPRTDHAGRSTYSGAVPLHAGPYGLVCFPGRDRRRICRAWRMDDDLGGRSPWCVVSARGSFLACGLFAAPLWALLERSVRQGYQQGSGRASDWEGGRPSRNVSRRSGWRQIEPLWTSAGWHRTEWYLSPSPGLLHPCVPGPISRVMAVGDEPRRLPCLRYLDCEIGPGIAETA